MDVICNHADSHETCRVCDHSTPHDRSNNTLTGDICTKEGECHRWGDVTLVKCEEVK